VYVKQQFIGSRRTYFGELPRPEYSTSTAVRKYFPLRHRRRIPVPRLILIKRPNPSPTTPQLSKKRLPFPLRVRCEIAISTRSDSRPGSR